MTRTETIQVEFRLTDDAPYKGATLDLEVVVEEDGDDLYLNSIRIVDDKYHINVSGNFLLEHPALNPAIYDKIHALRDDRIAADYDRHLESRREYPAAL